MGRMGRWQPDSAGRLVQAALALFGERGFDETTAEEIARQAGLTERTFFRYFADKREVLFYGAHELGDSLVRLVVEAPASATPIEAVTAALASAGTELQARREFAQRRQAVIAANPELRERELIKLANIASAIAEALRERGTSATTAMLAAETGMTIFRVAVDRWVEGTDEQDLPSVIRASLDELRAVTASRPKRSRPLPSRCRRRVNSGGRGGFLAWVVGGLETSCSAHVHFTLSPSDISDSIKGPTFTGSP